MFFKLFRFYRYQHNNSLVLYNSYRSIQQNLKNSTNWIPPSSSPASATTLTTKEHSATKSYLVKQTTHPPEYGSDNFLEYIKVANNSTELLNLIGINHTNINKNNIVQIFQRLFVLQKQQQQTTSRYGKSSSSTDEINNVNTSTMTTLTTATAAAVTAGGTSVVLQHSEFEYLCKILKRHLRTLQINDTIDILKILIFMNVPMRTPIAISLINLIRHQINDLQLGHIVFLDFLFDKVEQLPLIESIRLALPLLLQLNLNEQLDHDNVPQLLDLLAFIAKTPNCSKQCVMNVISALIVNATNLTVNDAKHILWSIMEMDIDAYQMEYDKLVKISIEILECNLAHMDPYVLERLFGKLIDRFSQLAKHTAHNNDGSNNLFYNDQFYKKCIEFIIECHPNYGFTNAVYLQRKLNKINYVNLKLLNYIAEQAIVNPLSLINAKPQALFSFVTGFSMANFKPANWDKLQLAIFQNDVIRSENITTTFSWIKFTVELLSLDVYRKELIAAIFNEEYLESYLTQTKSARVFHKRLDYLQLLQLYQLITILKPEYDGPMPSKMFINRAIDINTFKTNELLQKCCELCVGGTDFIVSNIKSKYGHFIDHAIVYNMEKEKFVKIDEVLADKQNSYYFDDLNEIDGHQTIGIMSLPVPQFCLNAPRLKGIFDLNIRAMEILGYTIVYVNIEEWLRLPDFEKIPYLEREIKTKL